MAEITNDNQKVKVTYPDDSSRETTVAELKEFFKDESQEWQQNFFVKLESKGFVIGRYGKYEIV